MRSTWEVIHDVIWLPENVKWCTIILTFQMCIIKFFVKNFKSNLYIFFILEVLILEIKFEKNLRLN